MTMWFVQWIDSQGLVNAINLGIFAKNILIVKPRLWIM